MTNDRQALNHVLRAGWILFPVLIGSGCAGAPDAQNELSEPIASVDEQSLAARRDAGTGSGSVSCGDLVEGEIPGSWSYRADDGAPGTLSRVTDAFRGSSALRLVTDSGFGVHLRYDVPAGQPLDASGAGDLRLAVRGTNTTPFGWQGNFPVVSIIDAAGHTRTFTPTSNRLETDGARWLSLSIPVREGATSTAWEASGEAVNLAQVVAIEVLADTWDSGFTLDIDAVSFERAGTVCAVSCPSQCSGHGTCNTESASCECALGWGGTACDTCADGFRPKNGRCVLARDGAYSYWPNAASKANSDPWLVVHHADIKVLRPKLLVLNFANPSMPAQTRALIEQIVAGFKEGSRARGYSSGSARAQLEYQVLPIVDLRDAVDASGVAHPPADYPFDNSALYPRPAGGAPGQSTLDYAAFFSSAFAKHYGFADAAAPGGYRDLCTLVERGDVNELWIVGSGDRPDANAAEVLEAKPRYAANGSRLAGPSDRCAGNGCFEATVPVCGRSVRIGFVNYSRGPGCYLHSQGHGMESAAGRGTVAAWKEWFVPFAGFDLDTKYGLPASNLYGLCSGPSCVSYPTPTSAVFELSGGPRTVMPFDAVCGSVHFPPNGREHYDYDNAAAVRTSCTRFGRRGNPKTEVVGAGAWAKYKPLAPDCGGEFLVYWMQNMPGHKTGQFYADGRAMPSVWPFLFY